MMQTEAKAATELTAKVVEEVKAELRNTTTDVKRNIAIGEEIKAVAQEVTEKDKTVVQRVKEMKDKAPPVRVTGQLIYAVVAANGMQTPGLPQCCESQAKMTTQRRKHIVQWLS